MKTAVVYWSMTGHSKRIAEAVANRLGVQAQNVKEGVALEPVDRLFLVSGIYGGQSNPTLLSWVKELNPLQVKSVALMTSSAAGVTPATQLREALSDRGIEVLTQEFTCAGSFLIFRMGRPGKQEIKAAVAFAGKHGNGGDSLPGVND